MIMQPIKLALEDSFCDVFTPYGYPGPLLTGSPSEQIISQMLNGFISEGRSRGVVSAFWRLHPLLSFPLMQLRQLGELVHHGPTVYIDLTLSREQLWKETSRNHRQDIKKLQKLGFVSVHNDWSYWERFISAYRETMCRVGAREFYCFSKEYFEELKVVLGDRLNLWTVLSPEGEVASAALLTAENGIIQYHLGATVDKFLDLSPNKLLVSQARWWGKDAGHRLLHLGGGLGGKIDSLYTFKARFSPLSTSFYTFRAILIPSIYNHLTIPLEGGQSTDDVDFFPAYRKLS